MKFIIEENANILHIRCSTGYILNSLKPKYGLGIDDSDMMIREAKKKFPGINFICSDLELIKTDKKFDYIIISSVEDIVDLKSVLDNLRDCCTNFQRIIIINYNYLWHPIVKFTEFLKLKIPQKLHNWFSAGDLENILLLCGFEKTNRKRIILFPYNIPIISYLINRFIARLPVFRSFTFIHISIARIITDAIQPPSVSVVIPCRNEAGNIEDAVKRIPEMGSHTEIIFCDDKSTDGTVHKIQEAIKSYPDKDIKLVYGPGICKSENVWTGFDSASGDILMILDADLTVIPEELPYFYEAISKNRGEFINGSRLVYPMHDEAMRFLKGLGNKFFSMFFSYILDTPIKDTLCGTKVLWKRDYHRIRKLRGSWGIMDRWGDYELIFGAIKCNLKFLELPVHYYERTYGITKMTGRIRNGWIMLKMSFNALFKIKFY